LPDDADIESFIVSGHIAKRAALAAARTANKAVDLASVHERIANRVGLIDKREILVVTGVSFPTIWTWMRANKFPRAHIVCGKSKWHAADIRDWLDGLPMRRLKGDEHSQL
jgi:predicted DNA-binding transcriptional regulator AlpA